MDRLQDYNVLRDLMVDRQVRHRGVNDTHVLSAMLKVERHLFFEEKYQHLGYEDRAFPIGEGQTISQPYMVGLMSEAMDLTGDEKVLEVGTGSGYQCAILAELAKYVFSVERLPNLAQIAKTRLEAFGYNNISVIVSDGTMGLPSKAPFSAIMVTAEAKEIPQCLIEQLEIGGRLIIPVGERDVQNLLKVVKLTNGCQIKTLLRCSFVPLIGKYGWKY